MADINASKIYTGIIIIDRFSNRCLINLSNLIQFSHIYTSSDAHFQYKSTGNIFRAGPLVCQAMWANYIVTPELFMKLMILIMPTYTQMKTGTSVSFLGYNCSIYENNGIPAEEQDTFADSQNHTLAEYKGIQGFEEFLEPYGTVRYSASMCQLCKKLLSSYFFCTTNRTEVVWQNLQLRYHSICTTSCNISYC